MVRCVLCKMLITERLFRKESQQTVNNVFFILIVIKVGVDLLCYKTWHRQKSLLNKKGGLFTFQSPYT